MTRKIAAQNNFVLLWENSWERNGKRNVLSVAARECEIAKSESEMNEKGRRAQRTIEYAEVKECMRRTNDRQWERTSEQEK